LRSVQRGSSAAADALNHKDNILSAFGHATLYPKGKTHAIHRSNHSSFMWFYFGSIFLRSVQRDSSAAADALNHQDNVHSSLCHATLYP
jgi:hypothetical protein